MATPRERWRPAVRTEQADGLMVLHVAGRLGEAGAADASLRAELDRAVDAGCDVIVDLSAVDYVSSPGLRLLEDCVNHAAGQRHRFVLCGLTDAVRVAVELAGLAPRLACAGSVEDAKEQCR